VKALGPGAEAPLRLKLIAGTSFVRVDCGPDLRPALFPVRPFFVEGPERFERVLRPAGDSNDSFAMSSEG
jgi:hypothetical protein